MQSLFGCWAFLFNSNPEIVYIRNGGDLFLQVLKDRGLWSHITSYNHLFNYEERRILVNYYNHVKDKNWKVANNVYYVNSNYVEKQLKSPLVKYSVIQESDFKCPLNIFILSMIRNQHPCHCISINIKPFSRKGNVVNWKMVYLNFYKYLVIARIDTFRFICDKSHHMGPDIMESVIYKKNKKNNINNNS